MVWLGLPLERVLPLLALHQPHRQKQLNLLEDIQTMERAALTVLNTACE